MSYLCSTLRNQERGGCSQTGLLWTPVFAALFLLPVQILDWLALHSSEPRDPRLQLSLLSIFPSSRNIFKSLTWCVPTAHCLPSFFFFFSCYRFLPFCNSVPLVQQLFNSEQRQVYMYLYVYLYSPVFELEPSLWHIHFTLIVLLCYSKTFNVFILLTG